MPDHHMLWLVHHLSGMCLLKSWYQQHHFCFLAIFFLFWCKLVQKALLHPHFLVLIAPFLPIDIPPFCPKFCNFLVFYSASLCNYL
uniref:Uncharacterized protein n=1 Tax=Rhizophora mucronata TaxID=61149 RepID=A0A2P2KQE5_RHIMU